MKFEELFKHKPGSVGAEMQKTINGLNEEIKQLRRQVANQAKLESENAKLKKELEWKTKRMKTLAEGLHGIEDVLKKTAASLFRDAVEDGSEDDPHEERAHLLRRRGGEAMSDRETAPYQRIADLERENAELRADRERLDWLTDALDWVELGDCVPTDYDAEGRSRLDAWRLAIDAARKEQP